MGKPIAEYRWVYQFLTCDKNIPYFDKTDDLTSLFTNLKKKNRKAPGPNNFLRIDFVKVDGPWLM